MGKSLINTADLRALIKSDRNVEAIAKTPKSVDGFVLHLNTSEGEKVLSTHLSEKPRLFKRSDALLKEAGKMGLKKVIFEL
ncbi:MAG: hypothetical protein JKY42_11675 [Flavobacteriales bacterium]|nr:hypothetical protein [Flavobacteriales bacterium]